MFSNLEAYRFQSPSGLMAATLSGGRSSGYQIAHFIEANDGLPAGIPVIFNNTGFERPETLDFVHAFDQHYSANVIWTEFDLSSPTKVRVVNYETASRDGRPMRELYSTEITRRDGTFGLRPLPNPVQRTCSATLKTKTSHRYLRQHLNWPNRYHCLLGYRSDERERYDRRLKQEARFSKNSCPEGGWMLAPMVHAGVTSEDVFDFWSKMPFDLGIESWQGNCDFCFMLAAWKLKDRMKLWPERVQPWIDMEEASRDRSNRFRKDRPSVAAIFAEVQSGNMSAPPQDLNIECGSCTGDFVYPEDADEEVGMFADLLG